MIRGKSIHHCTGSRKGKLFRTYPSRKKAAEVHSAIMASKSRARKTKARRLAL